MYTPNKPSKATLTNIQSRKWLNDNYLKDNAQKFKEAGDKIYMKIK